MKKIKVTLPADRKIRGYYGIVDGGIYTVDPTYDEYDENFDYRTVERVNVSKVTGQRGAVYINKSWCTIIPSIDLELPEELFDL